jgi:hypothetical protein
LRFFDSRDQKYDILAPFLKDAITVGDDVINIVDASDKAAHLDSLSGHGVPVHAAIETGKLRVLTSEQTYLEEGENVLPRLLDFLRETLHRAQEEKHCIRTWGEMNWVERETVPIEDVLEYEARVNELFSDFECTLLCVYDLARIPASLLSDILATHPSVIIQGRLRKNEHYVEPHEYLEMLHARRERGTEV